MSRRRAALVTGGGHGIGRAVAESLAREGWGVAITYASRADDAASTAEAVERAGGRALVTEADLRRHDEAERAVETARAAFGGLDALVHAVGSYHRAPLLEDEPARWLQAFDVNLHSFFYAARAVAPEMARQGWGRIVAFAVAGAEVPRAWRTVTAHHVSKLGLVALSRGLARELAGSGVTVNVIAPGFVDAGGMDADELERGRRLVPGGRLGSVGDVVAAVRFVLSDEASYVTGATIPVSGGYGL